VTEEEKSSSSPASRVQRKKKTHDALKTTPFWTKRVVSFKRERRQKHVHIGPQFVICSIKSSIAILI
jgi:hypothetical protein